MALRKTIRPALPKPVPFELEEWYSSESAKRAFSRISARIYNDGASTTLLGTADEPLLVLADADEHPVQDGDVVLTVDEAKADWAAMTTAAAIYGTRFRIKGKNVMRAVLFKHPDSQHPAEKYKRSQSVDVNSLALRIEALAGEIRGLGQNLKRTLSRPNSEDFSDIADRLGRSADVIDRRFREMWRLSNPHGLRLVS